MTAGPAIRTAARAARQPPKPGSCSAWPALALCVALAALGSGLAGAQGSDEPRPFAVEAIDPPQAAPELAFLDQKGHATNLADFRGRVVVLNLWATWCPPCISEMPSLDRLASRLAEEPFSIVAVSLDREGKRVVDAFYHRAGLATLPQYFDPRGRVAKDLATTGLPATVVIDHEGREIGRLNGSIDWSSAEALSYLQPLIARARAARSAGQ